MATTPEGKVKLKVKKVLAKYRELRYIYEHWPVPSGFGRSTLDCLASIQGLAFAIETKAPGEKPTPLQQTYIEDMHRAGMKVFVIDGDTTELEDWLVGVCASRP